MEYLVCPNLFSSHPNKDNTQLISEGGGKSQTYKVNCLSWIPSIEYFISLLHIKTCRLSQHSDKLIKWRGVDCTRFAKNISFTIFECGTHSECPNSGHH